MGDKATIITQFSPVTVPGSFNLVGPDLALMGTVGIPTTGMLSLVRQFDMFDHNAVSITILQAVAHNIAVTAPEYLDVFNLEYISPKCSTGNIKEIFVHT